jgi:hypothetical protein
MKVFRQPASFTTLFYLIMDAKSSLSGEIEKAFLANHVTNI